MLMKAHQIQEHCLEYVQMIVYAILNVPIDVDVFDDVDFSYSKNSMFLDSAYCYVGEHDVL